ncbi:hypothetical protein RJT34_12400 [Clitoria ternatea]|uniref:Uncharacterized protein n=1 Tax=Clitoria ternatea TaxID=43366 RepID=A0AAN9PKW3_CLITE
MKKLFLFFFQFCSDTKLMWLVKPRFDQPNQITKQALTLLQFCPPPKTKQHLSVQGRTEERDAVPAPVPESEVLH